ncbi:MAG: MutS-related protein [Eubacteriales bacterium]|jgi:hypothetical protein
MNTEKQKLSILFPYPDPSADKILPDGGNAKVIYDLSIDRMFEYAVPDIGSRSYFLSALAALPQNRENVLSRQQTLRDFYELPTLFDRFGSLFSRWAALRREWNDARSKTAGSVARSASRLVNASSEYYRSCYRLQVAAQYTRKIIAFIRGISAELTAAELRSEALIALRKEANRICSDPALASLDSICARYDSFAASNTAFDISPTFDDYLSITDVRARISTDLYSEEESGKKPGFLARLMNRGKTEKPEEGEYRPVQSVDIGDDGSNLLLLLNESVSDLSSVMSSAASALYGVFERIPEECAFYRTALRYIAFMEEKEVGLIYPEIGQEESRVIDIKALRDGLLAAASVHRGASDVIPNDVFLEDGGLIVVGDNNTGKTVYLRSIGAALLLGQAGVPIPAEKALISLRSSVLTHFASAEKDFLDGDVSGRFESEVKLVADINRDMDGGSLILLNETFQTTAYAEGAAGLWPILCHWSKKGGIWVLATHLRELLSHIGTEEGVKVTVAKTKPGYKIVREV